MNAARSQADGAYKAEADGCKALAGNAKDICKLEAKGHLSVAKAEAQYAYSGKPDDMRKVTKAKVRPSTAALERLAKATGSRLTITFEPALAR